MKTFIFSNCKKTDIATFTNNLLSKVPLDSRLIILNKGEVYYKVKAFDVYKNQIMVLRECGTHGLKGFFGLQNLAVMPQKYTIREVICFSDRGNVSDIEIGDINGNVTKKTIPTPWNAEYFANTGKAVTTGYAAYYLAQDIYGAKPEDIVLVNFYGNNDSSTGKWSGHAWDYENKWLQDKNRIYC